jgi:hypothetical protein
MGRFFCLESAFMAKTTVSEPQDAPTEAPPPIEQPFCANCRHFAGGSCPILTFVLDLHGQQPVSDCSHRELLEDPTITAGSTPEQE